MSDKNPTSLISGPPKVITLGVETLAEDLASQGVEVIHMDWTPPADGDPELADLLSKLGT